MPATLESNLRDVLESLARAAREVGRDPGAVHLVAVTKGVGPPAAEALVRLGQCDLGESRLDSLIEKHERVAEAGLPVTWHFIGPLQRNKARKVVTRCEVIHSVDSLRLIDALERVAAEEGRRPAIYLELLLTGEERKHGLPPGELEAAVRRAGEASHLELVGLMAMGPFPGPGEDPREASRPVFEELARLARRCREDTRLRACFAGGVVRLSMGMSGDHATAIACGSDVVRIGTALFEGIAPDEPIPRIDPRSGAVSEGSAKLQLQLVGEKDPPTDLPEQGMLVVGSAPAKAGLVVTGQGVAEVHCAIGRTKDGGWAVKDLGSEYGTLLNGRKITQARLQAGDQLLLGSRRLAVVDEGTPTVATESAGTDVVKPTPSGGNGPTTTAPRIRGYRIIQRLGRGAQGDVFLAVQESLDREVALKVLSARLEADQAFVDSFQAEARSAAALNHPNVVTVHDVGESGGVHYLTMEYMDHGSLEERVVREGPMHWRAVLDAIHDAASGLVYAESRGVVHRDIKPANLMQNHTGATKIADLGLAIVLGAETLADGSKKIFGTPHFISPEQVRGEMADCRSDLYSLGATAYRMLTGHTPFEGDDSREILRAKLRDDPIPLRHHVTDVPESMVRVVERLMRRDPAERFPSASSLLKELKQLRRGSEAAQVGQPAAGGSKLPRVVVPLLLVVAAVVAGLTLFGGEPDAPTPPGPDPNATTPVEPTPGSGEPGAGDGEPTPPPLDDDTQEKMFELKAENALLTLSDHDLNKADRRDRLRELAATYAGTTAATQASEEADRLDAEVLLEARTQLERDSAIADLLGALRAAAALDADPFRAGDSLRAMAAVPDQEKLAADPLFLEKRRALETEVLTRGVNAVQSGLDRVEDHYTAGDFEAMRELLSDLLLLTDLPEISPERSLPEVETMLELRKRIRNRLASIDDLRSDFEVAQVAADAAALTEALRSDGGLVQDLLALDFGSAAARFELLPNSLATELARAWSAALLERLRAADGAIPVLVRSWDEWRRKTVSDPRDHRGGSHEALGATEEGLQLQVRGELELVPWSAFGGKTHELHMLFNGRLSRPYTAAERDSIAALMSFSAIAEAIEHASEMFSPGSVAIFTEKEADELPAAFVEAAEWCGEAGRAVLEREREAAVLLASALRDASDAAWAGAVSSLELLLETYSDTLLVQMLSDGSGE